MMLWIDADACPVVNLAISVAAKYSVPVTLVCDDSHSFERAGADTITVAKGADSADLMLVNLLSPGDAVVTQDYGLAALCLARKALVLDQNGRRYTEQNIDSMLFFRHEAAEQRRMGKNGYGKHVPKRSAKQDKDFSVSLAELLSSLNASSWRE